MSGRSVLVIPGFFVVRHSGDSCGENSFSKCVSLRGLSLCLMGSDSSKGSGGDGGKGRRRQLLLCGHQWRGQGGTPETHVEAASGPASSLGHGSPGAATPIRLYPPQGPGMLACDL